MIKEFILLLGANQFQRERALIGAEKAFNEMVVTISPLAPFHTNKYPSITICSNETNPEQLLTDVISFCSQRNMTPKAVIPLNDFVLNAGLKIAEHFELPYNSKETITNCRTKDLMKNVLISNNLPAVKSLRFSTVEEAKKLAQEIGYPVVIKPLNFGGSGGVSKIENDEELASNILSTKNHLHIFAKKYDSEERTLLIEPYITIKKEVSVEVINTPAFRKVIGITDKFLGQEPYFSEVGHMVPSLLNTNPTISSKINETALKACEALNIQYGMAHVEMKVGNEGEVIIVEVGVRTAGDGIMDLYEKATHKNIYELHCKAFLNQLTAEDLPKEFYNLAAVGYFHPKIGVIEKISTDSLTANDLDKVDLISIQTKIGQIVAPAKDWSTRNGFVEFTLSKDILPSFNLIERTMSLSEKIFSIQE